MSDVDELTETEVIETCLVGGCWGRTTSGIEVGMKEKAVVVVVLWVVVVVAMVVVDTVVVVVVVEALVLDLALFLGGGLVGMNGGG